LLPSFTSDDDDGCLYFFRKCMSGIFCVDLMNFLCCVIIIIIKSIVSLSLSLSLSLKTP
jgi:hypothetical protein